MRYAIKILFLVFIILSLTGLTSAQSFLFPYYGKNRVFYVSLEWSVYPTEHFDIYTYNPDPEKIKIIAELAESAYQTVSENMKHQLSARVPLMYYRTTTDFQQSNLFRPSAGVLGVSEPLLYRVAVHGDMSLDELQDLMAHEMSHIFQFDLLWGSPGGVLYAVTMPPGWMFEGLSEYNTGKWAPWSELIVRDATLTDRIPEFTQSAQLYSQYPLPRTPDYEFGHAIYDFIESKYGKNGIRELWHSMKNISFIGRTNPIKRAFNQDTKEFGFEFNKYLRERYKSFLVRESPADYSLPLGPNFPVNPYYYVFSHAISPSGDIVAVLTINARENDLDIIYMSTEDGRVIKNITKGYTLKYQQIKFEVEPSKGSDLAWSPDGDHLAFFARSGQKHGLYLLDALSGKTLQSVKIPHDQPSSPKFIPGTNEVVFTAFEDGVHDIFKVNLDTEKIIKLTDDDLFEKAPAVSHDGKFIAYSIRIDAFDKLFVSPLDNLDKKTQLTFGRNNTITPSFSKDDKRIFFVGDQLDAFNVYSIDLETGDLWRYTDVRTGNFFPLHASEDPDEVVFASFHKGSFQIYKSELEGSLEKTISFAEKIEKEEIDRFDPIISLEVNKDDIKPYAGMGKLYMANRPPVDAVLSTDGSLYGGTAITFTDLFADYAFNLMVYQVRSFRSYVLSFVNQKNNFKWMATAYSFTEFYYPQLAYYDPYLWSRLSYRDAMATRTTSGIDLLGYYPLSLYFRFEGGLSYTNFEEDFYQSRLPTFFSAYPRQQLFRNGNYVAASVSFVGETTRFRYYGPAAGNTFKLTLRQGIPLSSSFIQNTNLITDLRHYQRVGMDSLLAFRFYGFSSRGRDPFLFYFGGNNQIRSSYYYSIVGNEGWFANLELRFPLINRASTFIGNIGPVRGTLFADLGRTKFKGQPAEFRRAVWTTNEQFPRIETYEAVGSYGFGFEFFFLGLPIHFDFAKRIEVPRMSTPFKFDTFGKFELKFWIGYDF